MTETFLQDSTEPKNPQQTWKSWNSKNSEFERFAYVPLIFDDKILIVGGYEPFEREGSRIKLQTTNILLVDPRKEELKILPPQDPNTNFCFYNGTSACYWKDSKMVIFGGRNPQEKAISSTVSIITLQDLSSENPSAHWEKVHTENVLRRRRHATHIYQDKMYVFGGYSEKDQPIHDIWCLDLDHLKWSQCQFTDRPTNNKIPCDSAVFQENKAYIVSSARDKTVIEEYDLETLTFKTITGPGIPDCMLFTRCQQMVDGKIYGLSNCRDNETKKLVNQVWSYDMEANQWTETKIGGVQPPVKSKAELLFCNDQLVLYGGVESGKEGEYGETWSLPLNFPKKKPVATKSLNITKAQQSMKDFLAEAPYSDISFEVEAQVFKAHKWWLCKKSKYFANMFSSGMSEAQASIIKISDMKALTFQAFLEFLYSDHIELDNVLALELLQQADKFSIPQLTKECEAYLVKNLTSENYVAVAEIAEILEIVSLREAVVSFIAKNVKELKKRKDFEQISVSLLRESIVKFIVK